MNKDMEGWDTAVVLPGVSIRVEIERGHVQEVVGRDRESTYRGDGLLTIRE